jgi:hypothetical protein
MTLFPEITPQDKRACLQREIKMRRKVYPRWVAAGNMTQEQADREIAVMEAIERDYAPK